MQTRGIGLNIILFLVSTTEAGDAVDDVQVLEVGGDDPTGTPVGSSRVSGPTDSAEVDNNPLQSQLLPTDVMDHYLERAKKLRLELKRVTLHDHDWYLKTFDLNGTGVVKLWYAECKKDCGRGRKDHTEAYIDNLFNNFRQSHIVSVVHIRNYCASKNLDFNNHMQSKAQNGRLIIIIPDNQGGFIAKGIQIMEAVNLGLPEMHNKLTMLGNVQAQDTRCYWFKVKCPYCRELIVLCPPRKTLFVFVQHLKIVDSDAVTTVAAHFKPL